MLPIDNKLAQLCSRLKASMSVFTPDTNPNEISSGIELSLPVVGAITNWMSYAKIENTDPDKVALMTKLFDESDIRLK